MSTTDFIKTIEFGYVSKSGLDHLVSIGAIARVKDDYMLTTRGLSFGTKKILDYLTSGVKEVEQVIPEESSKIIDIFAGL